MRNICFLLDRRRIITDPDNILSAVKVTGPPPPPPSCEVTPTWELSSIRTEVKLKALLLGGQEAGPCVLPRRLWSSSQAAHFIPSWLFSFCSVLLLFPPPLCPYWCIHWCKVKSSMFLHCISFTAHPGFLLPWQGFCSWQFEGKLSAVIFVGSP